jgi:protein-tyrosine phosphatase
MRDLHCHILPGVDDGSPDLETSLRMLEAAKAAGITSITCTPHCRKPYFNGEDDFKRMWEAFYDLEDAADGFPLQMGFEVNYRKLMELGIEWAEVLHFDESNEFLLELSVGSRSSRYDDYERTIFELQGMGYEVIIAHPERYLAIQKDIGLAEELVRMGCKLQCSTDFIAGGRFGAERRPAMKMLKEGLISYFASDAHNVKHYEYFVRAHQKFGHLLIG